MSGALSRSFRNPRISVAQTSEVSSPQSAPAESAERAASETDLEDAAFVLTYRDLRILSPYLGRNILSRTDLIDACRSLTTLSVNGVEITLERGLLSRLKSRSIRVDFSEWLRGTVVRCLHEFVGW